MTILDRLQQPQDNSSPAGRILTATFILCRSWPSEAFDRKNNQICDLYLAAIKNMPKQELAALKYYSDHGTFIGMELPLRS